MSINIENINNNIPKITDNNIEEKKNNSRILKIKDKAQEMEALFLTQMVKAMRKTVPDNSWSGTKSKNNLASMMFSSVMGKAMAKSGGIGLADEIFNSLKDMNEEQIQELQLDQIKENSLP